ncbi:MAG: AAA family ATPase, partial [Desulfobacterales bacterium]
KDIVGIQFAMADALARQLGISEDDPKRIHACIYHILEQHASDGHMYAIEDQLIKRCWELLNIGKDEIDAGIDALIDAGELVRCAVSNENERGVFLKAYHQIETGTANRLTALLSVPALLPDIDTTLIIDEVLKKLAIKLSPEQLDVLEGIFSHRVAIITGGPGTGKTTLIRSITAILSLMGREALLAAPTGRAARRLSEVTRMKTSTIHKLLGFNYGDGDFEKDQDDPLDADIVIIDEASMVDATLMFHLLKAVPMSAGLILVGDVFQLPSVGPGNVLSDLIQSHRIQTYELKTIYRQAQESNIVMNAHRVRMGEQLDLAGPDHSDFYFIRQQNPERAVETIVKLCSESIPRKYNLDRIGDIQVLTPMHKGAVGTINLNQVLQKALNSEPEQDGGSRRMFRTGDKVMHLKNNYQKDVFNGDIGTVRTINSAENMLSVDYEGRIVDYDFEELDELSLAYAISVHKSQGSEYPAVIVPLMTQHYPLLQRNLLYTAMTRGKRLVIFVGTQQALDIALKNDKPRKRLSSLAYQLSAHETRQNG